MMELFCLVALLAAVVEAKYFLPIVLLQPARGCIHIYCIFTKYLKGDTAVYYLGYSLLPFM